MQFNPVPGSLDKKEGEEDATFYLIKDGTFSPPSLSNEPGTVQRNILGHLFGN
jgi:hypothetical protein